MLFEVRAEGFSYDMATDTARVRAPGATGPGRQGLLDAKGFLVGVDLRGEDGRGAVVMLGPHEAVSGTTELSVTVQGDEVVVAGARATIRAHEKNPYVGS
jgi:hypothetical protein